MEKIKTEEEYNQILKRLDEIFDAKKGTKEGEELERLVSLIEDYEKELTGDDLSVYRGHIPQEEIIPIKTSQRSADVFTQLIDLKRQAEQENDPERVELIKSEILKIEDQIKAFINMVKRRK